MPADIDALERRLVSLGLCSAMLHKELLLDAEIIQGGAALGSVGRARPGAGSWRAGAALRFVGGSGRA